MVVKKDSKNYCQDCGNAQVHHGAEKMTNILTSSMDPMIKPIDRIWRHVEPVIRPTLNTKILPRLFKFLAKVGLGKITHEPDSGSTGRARCFWNECNKRGIKISEFRLLGRGRELFMAEYEGQTLAFDGLPRPGVRKTSALYWMDNKAKMREEFSKAGIPVAQGGRYFWWWKAKRDFKKLTKPVIIKPHQGSRSRHTTTHIETLEQLRVAFKKAKQLSPYVIMEEEHTGFVYRGTLIGEKVVGVLRREPPCVVGDGVHSVFELIEIENQNPMRDENIFHKIVLGDEAATELDRQSLVLADVPEKGRVVMFSQKSSRGLGGGATDVTDIIHPDNLEILNKIAQVLQDPLVGVDFMIADIEKSWRDQKRAGVIECNSMPFIDLHLFPLRGEVRDTAAVLCDLVFPTSKTHQSSK